MRTFTKEELDKIIENHQHWIREDCDGWVSMRANLSLADLSGADLSGANLSGAELYHANLCGADLRSVDLRHANLGDADLSGADLRSVDLRSVDLHYANLGDANLSGADLRSVDLHYANLRDANLSGADLSGANLRNANLSGADLSGANLRNANLRDADLRNANLRDADLRSVDLRYANLRDAKNIPFIPMACPDTGSFTGWKKCTVLCGENLDVAVLVIVELEIPAYAKRSSATGRKCRCDKAIVKSITSIDGSESFDSAFSKHDPNFIYWVGKVVSVGDFDENRFNECAPGIHFFINRQEAVDYVF